MIKTGIEHSAYFNENNYLDGISLLKKHGYDCIDYGDMCLTTSPYYSFDEQKYFDYLKNLKECADRLGVEFYQMHGNCPRKMSDQEFTKPTLDFIKQLKTCNALDCKRLVIHPYVGDGSESAQVIYNKNVQMLTALTPALKEYGVILAIENLPFRPLEISKTATLKKLVRQINNPFIKICFDTGHAFVLGENIYDDVILLESDLEVLHVHDNVGNAEDRHLPPYQGLIDWDSFALALNKIHYKGCLSLETFVNPKTPQPMLDQIRIALSNIAKSIANKINV